MEYILSSNKHTTAEKQHLNVCTVTFPSRNSFPSLTPFLYPTSVTPPTQGPMHLPISNSRHGLSYCLFRTILHVASGKTLLIILSVSLMAPAGTYGPKYSAPSCLIRRTTVIPGKLSSTESLRKG